MYVLVKCVVYYSFTWFQANNNGTSQTNKGVKRTRPQDKIRNPKHRKTETPVEIEKEERLVI